MAAVAGLLLTGGSSRRMGVSKAELRRDGERLADRGARLLRSWCAPVLEVGPRCSGLPSVREQPAGGGPLAALVAGWDALTASGQPSAVLVLAVDLPRMDDRVLHRLRHHPSRGSVVPRIGGAPQPLCARYAPGACEVARALVTRGERSMRALLDAVPVTYLDDAVWGELDAIEAFTDVDTPEAATACGLEWPR